jgi:hypothetical protein
MNIFEVMNTLWEVLRGETGAGAPDFVAVYTALGAILWAFLLFKVFLTEGISVASGSRSELPRIFIKYLFVAAMFTVWPAASNQIADAVIELANIFYPDLTTLLDRMLDGAAAMTDAQQAEQAAQGVLESIIGTFQNITSGYILSGISILVLFLCYMVILICMVGSLTILFMNLVLAPVFFALSFDKDFRQIAVNWFTGVLSYFVLIPLYGAAINVAAAIAGMSVPTNIFGLSSSGAIAVQLLGPFMAVGVVLSTNKVVNSLIGGAAGGGLATSAIGAMAAAGSLAAGGSLMAGGATLRPLSAAGGAVLSAGKAVASKLSATARAAKGGNNP